MGRTKSKDSPLLVFDYDYLLYSVGFACETRQEEVIHIPSGRKQLFKNKTAFWGRSKSTIGGWLGELNESRLERGLKPFERDEFSFETVREVESVEYVLSTVKKAIKGICDKLGTNNYRGYIGKGEGFRVEASTLLEYKGNRKDALRPLMKDEITEYLVKFHNAKIIEDMEADDAVIIDAYKNNGIVVAVDKDAMGNPVKVFNPNNPEAGVVDCSCFGELFLDEKNKLRGYGRLFFYSQLLTGDGVDNYKPNCFSDLKWADVSTYEALSVCKNDKQAMSAVVDVLKQMYPEPKEIVGWRGDIILIDWKYVLSEMWTLAKMLRWEGDDVTAEQAFKKMGINYE